MKKRISIATLTLLVALSGTGCGSGGLHEPTTTAAIKTSEIETTVLEAESTTSAETDNASSASDELLSFGFTPEEFYNNYVSVGEYLGITVGDLTSTSDFSLGFLAQPSSSGSALVLLVTDSEKKVTFVTVSDHDKVCSNFSSVAAAAIVATDIFLDFSSISDELNLSSLPTTSDDVRSFTTNGISFDYSTTHFLIMRDFDTQSEYSYKPTDLDVLASIQPENDFSETTTETIPSEYKSALNKANTYSNMMHMSKAGIYNQLTSEYGEKFTDEAAQYAIENMEADWNANALEKAKSYNDTMHMSKKGIYEQLISEAGEQFTEDEAQYAVDNLRADWNKNALEKAKSYQKTMNMSPAAIHDQLTSEYGEQFTQEEADYAIAHLE